LNYMGMLLFSCQGSPAIADCRLQIAELKSETWNLKSEIKTTAFQAVPKIALKNISLWTAWWYIYK
jgi:hypothetical protein